MNNTSKTIPSFHVLVVEDEPVTLALIAGYIRTAGYQVSEAKTGTDMWLILNQNKIDLLLMDINLPDEDGLSLTRRLRTISNIAIILVTARKEEIDRIAGLELGADDYITKPFHERELLIRVKNLLNRTSQKGTLPPEKSYYRFGGWILDPHQHKLTSPNQEYVRLTNGEFLLLLTLVQNANTVLTRETLTEAVSKRELLRNDRTIDVMVNRLRKKLDLSNGDAHYLVTVHGAGYMLAINVVYF
ncbi:MAG: response regulator [Magnetococcus sp. DMHC-6]